MSTRTITLPNVKVTLSDDPSGQAQLDHVQIGEGEPIAMPGGRVDWRRRLVAALIDAALAEEASPP